MTEHGIPSPAAGDSIGGGGAQDRRKMPGCRFLVKLPDEVKWRECGNALPSSSGGRERLYCGQKIGGRVHNAQNALTARRAQEQEDAEVRARAGLEELPSTDVAQTQAPVDLARARTGLLIEKLQTQLTPVAAAVNDAMDQLRILVNPDMADLQVEAGAAQARAMVAQATAARASAEEAARRAGDHAAEMEQLAAAAAAGAEAAEQARAEAAHQAANALQRAEHARHQLDEQVLATTAEASARQAAEAEGERQRQVLADVTADREALASRLATVETRAAADAATASARQAADAEQITRLTSDLAAVRDQADQLHTEVRAADAIAHEQTARAAQAEADRVRLQQDLAAEQTAHAATRTSLVSALDIARDELAQARATAAADIARLTAELQASRSQADQLHADLTTTRKQVETQLREADRVRTGLEERLEQTRQTAAAAAAEAAANTARLTTELTVARTQVQTLTAELTTTREQARTDAVTATAATARLTAIQEEVDQLRHELHDRGRPGQETA